MNRIESSSNLFGSRQNPGPEPDSKFRVCIIMTLAALQPPAQAAYIVGIHSAAGIDDDRATRRDGGEEEDQTTAGGPRWRRRSSEVRRLRSIEFGAVQEQKLPV